MLHALLDPFLERLKADPLRALPRFVRRELEGYLACGVPGGSFARLRCDACEREELVYFSCKGRGYCPSCGGRRMADRAARLVDRVLPHVPVRQWVFTLPWELRTLVAYNRKVLVAVRRIWWEELSHWLCRRGEEEGVVAPRPGAVNVIQRFGGARPYPSPIPGWVGTDLQTIRLGGGGVTKRPGGSARVLPGPPAAGRQRQLRPRSGSGLASTKT